MNCTICGKPIKLVPSAEERAKKDLTGKTAADYRSLFTEHSDCTLRKRAEDTSKLMAERKAGTEYINPHNVWALNNFTGA